MINSSFEDDGNSVFDDVPQSQFTGDSSLVLSPAFDPKVLKIYQTGEMTVVGFADCDPDEFCIASYREQLCEIVNKQHCKMLTIDLSGVKLIPSGMLGLLVSLRKQVERIVLLNPCADIQEVLQLTHFDTLVEIQTKTNGSPHPPTA